MAKEYKDYYIAFIDILGFKKIIGKKQCEEICNIYESIKQFRTMRKEVKQGKETLLVPVVPPKDVHIKIMSDSVCIYIPADAEGSLFLLSFMCADFQCRMLKLDTPILLRGAITKGKLYFSGDILFGPGFVDAYLMEENNASVPRIIINKAIIDEYKSLGNIFPDNMAFRDYDAFYSLEYISLIGSLKRENKEYEELYRYIRMILDSTTDESVRNKFLYLESKVLPYLNKKIVKSNN